MYTNTEYFTFGDQKFGEDGWTDYWFMWAMLYSPMLLYGMVLNWFKNDQMKDYIKCNMVLILLLSIFIEISFINDLSWRFIIIEYVIIGIVWIYVLRLKMFLSKRFT